MAAALRSSATYRASLQHLLRPSGGSIFLHSSSTSPTFNKCGVLPRNQHVSRMDYSTDIGPGGRVMKWIRRRILAVLAIAGLSGAVLFVVSIMFLVSAM